MRRMMEITIMYVLQHQLLVRQVNSFTFFITLLSRQTHHHDPVRPQVLQMNIIRTYVIPFDLQFFIFLPTSDDLSA